VTTALDVRREITVPGSPARVFDLFTNHMSQWWPAAHHIATSPIVGMTVEPEVGGRIYDSCEDGSESVWGRITEWEPPARFAFAWMLTGTWQLETDIDKASRVSISFQADGGQTRIELVHDDFWRLADGGQGMFEAVGSADGWPLGLERFAAFVAG
jgi:uncharacterized protein YndB with AHSA1/START domain